MRGLETSLKRLFRQGAVRTFFCCCRGRRAAVRAVPPGNGGRLRLEISLSDIEALRPELVNRRRPRPTQQPPSPLGRKDALCGIVSTARCRARHALAAAPRAARIIGRRSVSTDADTAESARGRVPGLPRGAANASLGASRGRSGCGRGMAKYYGSRRLQ